MRWIAAAALAALPAFAGSLKPETVAAFDRYIQETEQRLDQQKASLWSDEKPDRAQRVRGGEVVVEPFHAKALTEVPHGLIHDWVGAVFLPGVKVEQALALVQDYDKAKENYRPEVIDSRLVSRDGNHFRVFMRLLKKQVITVVLDTDHDVLYEKAGDKAWRSASRTTRISEVENAGKSNERALPPGTGQGFLWRLYSYWRFVERDGGTWIECEAISLTRDVPTGLGWIIEPIIKNLPKNSLRNTLESTRRALSGR
jgi:hypothetical protein